MADKIDSISKKVLIKGSVTKEELTEDRRVADSLHYSTMEGIFNTASGNINSTYLVPFALSLRATSADVGILTAVQNLASTLSQIPGAILTEYYSRKAIWMFSQLFGKVILWIPVAFLAFFSVTNAVFMLILLVALLTFAMGLRSPAWASMMGDIVPLKIRGRYFGSRNMVTSLAGIIMTLLAGVILTYYGFSTIFLIYIILSAIAIPYFLKMYEPPMQRVYHYKHRFAVNPKYWRSSLAANRGLAIFTVYLMVMSFAIAVSGPFYAVYMLRDLNISYIMFGVLAILGAFARIVSFKYWGRLNDRYGSRKIFIVTSFFAIFVPLIWMFVSDPLTIALVMIYEGFIFSGFDQVAFNYLIDITPSERRPQYVANHNFFVGIGVVLGALSGGLLATLYEGQTLLIFGGLQIVFLISFLIRVATLIVVPQIPEIDVEHSKAVPVQYVFWQAMAVEPVKGINNAIHYTFRYPYEIEREFKNELRKIRYKIKMKRS